MSTKHPDEPAPDYTDRFAIARSTAGRTPEAWMRSALEGAPTALRGFLLFGWRVALGFRPGPRHSAAHVLGWPIADNGGDRIVLRQRSALMTADLTLRTGGAELVWTTRLRYHHRAARAVWPVVRLIHVRVVPYVLRHARVPSRR